MNDRWATSEDDVESWEGLHDGQAAIRVQHYFAGKLPWPIDVDLWEIPVGGSEGWHRHAPEDTDGYAGIREMYVLLDGLARVLVGDEWRQLGRGDAVFVEPDTPRAVHNCGDVPLRLLFVSDRPDR